MLLILTSLVLIVVGLVCFCKLDSEGYQRISFMLTYLTLILYLVDKLSI
ncbi:hypothetical protein [Alkaliphilus sp. B6464]|nr:hypothetical protein [Alkaliphilus sp. B6464]QUH20250.1 hypothetical protein HYG84_10250 [Alkaliphilus sp. B6464]